MESGRTRLPIKVWISLNTFFLKLLKNKIIPSLEMASLDLFLELIALIFMWDHGSQCSAGTRRTLIFTVSTTCITENLSSKQLIDKTYKR
jgi:hypothetical protein